MTTIIAEVFDALKEAGASDERARKAAETLANYDNQFAEIRTGLKVHRWMFGVLTTIGMGNLFLSDQLLSRLAN
jgi:hypothetical protein